jgi:DNA anti-recombination protein RmuC
VIRQSLENFRLEARTNEIQAAIGKFRKQWDMYKEQMDSVGKSIGQTGDKWEELVGKRQRQLDRHIERVDQLKSGSDEALPPVSVVEEEILELAAAAEDITPRVTRTDHPDSAGDLVADASEAPLF